MARADEAAFARPQSRIENRDPFELHAQIGLTKREMIAALALQGLLTNGETALRYELAAHYAVEHADALLEELAK